MLDELQEIGTNIQGAAAVMRQATAMLLELQSRVEFQDSLIESYRRKDADHERLIGKLYEMARNKASRDELLLWDEFCDLVTDAYLAIHGPSD